MVEQLTCLLYLRGQCFTVQLFRMSVSKYILSILCVTHLRRPCSNKKNASYLVLPQPLNSSHTTNIQLQTWFCIFKKMAFWMFRKCFECFLALTTRRAGMPCYSRATRYDVPSPVLSLFLVVADKCISAAHQVVLMQIISYGPQVSLWREIDLLHFPLLHSMYWGGKSYGSQKELFLGSNGFDRAPSTLATRNEGNEGFNHQDLHFNHLCASPISSQTTRNYTK